MDCKTVMAPIKVSLFADDPAGVAIDFMVEHHSGLVPVVNRDGTFAGLISGDGLMPYLLPKSLHVAHTHHRRAGLRNVSFLHETAEEMQERLDALRQRPIAELIDKDAKTVGPDTPLIDALMMIKSKQYVVPVVDENNTLVGAISFFSVLYGLDEDLDRDEAAAMKDAERAARTVET